MKIKWLGHSCFLLTSAKGTRILTDPCDQTTGYKIAPVEVDAVTCSHDHFDHNYHGIAMGENVPYITTVGNHQVKDDVKIIGIHTFHDEKQGALRGENIIFVFEMDSLRIAHLGDLGHMPDAKTMAAIGHTDILLAPVGGVFTIDHGQALELANLLQPKVVIPMHYLTDVLTTKVSDVTPFLDNAKNYTIHRMRQSEVDITKESLGDDRIIVLDYEKFQ